MVVNVKFISPRKVRLLFDGDDCHEDWTYCKSKKGTRVIVNGINHILYKKDGEWNIIEEDLYEV